jgi:hypothetical protein
MLILQIDLNPIQKMGLKYFIRNQMPKIFDFYLKYRWYVEKMDTIIMHKYPFKFILIKMLTANNFYLYFFINFLV